MGSHPRLSKNEKIQHKYPYLTKQSINAAAFSFTSFDSFSIFKGLRDECFLSSQHCQKEPQESKLNACMHAYTIYTNIFEHEKEEIKMMNTKRITIGRRPLAI